MRDLRQCRFNLIVVCIFLTEASGFSLWLLSEVAGGSTWVISLQVSVSYFVASL